MTITLEEKNDFYKLINSDKNIENTINIDSNNLCKICDIELEDNYIELSCGHRFNYMPLYNEILYQKTNKYSLSYDYTKLNLNQIKCPYCRTISNNILPYLKFYNVDMIRGVNYPFKYSMKIHSCQYHIKSTNKNCEKSACITPNGILCNKHYLQNIAYKNNTIDNMKVIELKNLLRKNKCRVSGKKNILIERIKEEKNKNSNWLD
tara:strand:+ start:1163 stop:1780 length:618 start_codon:yes stop_codon:yes gene_type:complete